LGINEKELSKMMKKKSALKIKPDGQISASASSDEEKNSNDKVVENHYNILKE